MLNHHGGRLAAMLLGLAMGASAHTAAAYTAPAAAQPFDIAAGPAAEAVAAFARQAGIQVLAGGDVLAGRATNAVQGSLPVAQALQQLLDGTGLASHVHEGGAVFIVPAPEAHAQAVPRILVPGQRLAEQTAIERKKDADTGLDAIAAEDVGSFPDRNVAEAVSRIAGVALERNEFGEGTHVSIRGNSAAVTRVEIDGLIVPSPGGTDQIGGGGGRATEFRDLPTDLIASVDVVKGATTDMTEGSLGGGILIRTRTGFDFKRRTISLRAAGQTNTINGKWLPNLNLAYADQFLDGRLGMVLNVSRQKTNNEAHTVKHTQDLRYAYARDVDYDQSPEKTFALNPATLDLSQRSATLPVPSPGAASGTFAVTGGGMPFANLAPADIVQRSAAAQTKQDCFAAFPQDPAQFASIASATHRVLAQTQRAQELRSCLGQWNDYVPGMVRYFHRTQQEDRLNSDMRLDFRVNDRLTVFGKFNRTRHDILDTQNAISMGNIGTTADATNYTAGAGMPALRTLSAAGSAAGYALYPGNVVTPGVVNGVFGGLHDGIGVNVLPGTLQVDDRHHVTGAVLSNASFTNDTIAQPMQSTSRTSQFGATWRSGRLKADFMHGSVASDFWRYGLRGAFDFRYGPVRAGVAPDGVWQYDFSGGVDPLRRQLDTTLYGNVGAPAAPGQPARESGSPLALRIDGPRAGEMSEKNTRLDLAYRSRGLLPFVDSLRFGINRRVFGSSFWVSPAAGSATVVTPGSNGQQLVVLPSAARNSLVHVCEDTAGSLAAGGTPCTYGFVPNPTRNSVGSGDYYLTTAAFRDMMGQALATRTSPFFHGAGSGPAGMGSWAWLDAAKLFGLIGVPPVDTGCIKACIASDGNVYEQPRTSAFETVNAGYLTASFAVDRLPFTDYALPWEVTGNFGYRVVRTDVRGRGALTFTAITTNPGWDPLAHDEDVTTSTVTRNVTLVNRTRDYLPILNVAIWPVADVLGLRYHRSKAVARPSTAVLVPGGASCTYDERLALRGAAGSTCDGVLGNPALRAQTNQNQELSLEWTPNRDSSVALALFRQKGLVGTAIRVPVTGQRPFAGADLALPGGRALDDVPFDYDTWVNGPANSRRGLELSAKTAFTFLPSVLRHTGINANFTTVRSKTVEGALYELQTGDPLAPVNEYRYSWNTSLWYDDGRLDMRVALQVNTQAFTRFQNSLAATSPYPAAGIDVPWVTLPLSPPTASFRDARRFIDARLGYKFGNGIEAFVEGRNLGNKSITNSMGRYGQFTQGPALLDMNYSGVRILTGIVIRN